ncbi:hypothetical protein ABW19_dt0201779 [Dactylella cylindrospora]|nr:hypothetical protein ABW19_dt0201779 [Dactylella cylindrospora]
MIIGLAALVLAVSAYIFKEGIPGDILVNFAKYLGFFGVNNAKAITDGSENSNGYGDAHYKSGLPSRKGKEELLIMDDDDDDDEEDDGQKTPTNTARIELSVSEIELEVSTVKETARSKGKARRRDSDEDLIVPMFPALNSAQRASAPSIPPPTIAAPSLVVPGIMGPPPLPVPKLPQPSTLAAPSLSMPPPPIPNRRPPGINSAANARSSQYSSPTSALRVPGSSSLGVPVSSSLGVPQSSSLAVPQQRNSLQLPPTHSAPPPKPRQKVILTPGHSSLDWANHQKTLPFVPLRRITPSELATHGPRKNEAKTYWTALEGKVYDVTPYLPYHPGGDKEVLRVCGKDGTKLFNLTHPWVNFEHMLRGCEVGILVSENEIPSKNGVDEVDLESMD